MKEIKVALAGNPNVGKTTVFNALTGLNQHIGNWPGKTVEKKEGKCKFQNNELNIVDLPGTYSLTAYSIDEIVARDYILDEDPDVVVHIIDSTNIERNMYLTTQLLELDTKVILALNMYDLVKSRKIDIDIPGMSNALDIPIIPIVASKKQGIDNLLSKILEVSKEDRRQKVGINFGKDLEKKIIKIEKLLENSKYPKRWLAIKILENDEKVIETIEKFKNKDKILNLKEKITDQNTEIEFSEKRYEIIEQYLSRYVVKPQKNGLYLSDMIDKVVTHKYFGMPIFLMVIWILFQLTFTIAQPFVDLIDMGFADLSNYIDNNLKPSWLASFLGDGIIGGVGFVLIFFPNIFILFLLLSFLEDSGYLARVAFVMDRLMTYLGLHGKSFIPLILGFGCNVPGIMATRTIENRNDRLITILAAPFVSCSARLPVYLILAGTFFSKHAATVIFLLYVLGLIIAVSTAKLLRMIIFRGESNPLIMELPSYKNPNTNTTLKHAWNKGYLYIRKAGTIILLGAIIIWFLASLPWGKDYGSEDTYIASLGKIIEPVFEPLGFDWKIAVALILGFVAKEIVIGSLGVLYGVGRNNEGAISDSIKNDPNFTSLIALELMVFTLIYTPCLAAVAAIKRETNSWKWTSFSIIYSISLAYIVTLIIRIIGVFLGY